MSNVVRFPQPRSLDPDDLRAAAAGLEIALAGLGADAGDGPYDLRRRVALTIIEEAFNGEHDPQRLAQLALQRLGSSVSSDRDISNDMSRSTAFARHPVGGSDIGG